MNSELQKCRQHYELLPSHIKDSSTAHFLITTIEISEQLAKAVAKLRRGDFPSNEQPLWNELQAALARVTKPDGK